jgi:hypothetical protein
MQQDERHAVCADVAVWTVAYTFFRRGIIARSLIADIVQSVRRHLPMSPTTPAGAHPPEISAVLNKIHIGTRSTQTTLSGHPDMEKINAASMQFDGESVDALLDLILKAGDDVSVKNLDPDERRNKNRQNFMAAPMTFIQGIIDVLDGLSKNGTSADSSITRDDVARYSRCVTRLLDDVYAYLLTPYLASGCPIICCPPAHAMVLVGISRDEQGPIFYFNDDQYGPYLASRSFTGTTRAAFQKQAFAGKYERELGDRAPAVDYATSIDQIPTSGGWRGNRGPRVLIIPTAARLLLSPAKAQQHASKQLDSVISELLKRGRPNTAGRLLSDLYRVRTVAMMGIDYKTIRRNQSKADETLNKLFSVSHLSEWVLLVEGLIPSDSGEEVVDWEIVYDGTSADLNPLIQMARVRGMCLAVHPKDNGLVSICQSESTGLPPAPVPIRVGKSDADGLVDPISDQGR